MNRPFTPDPKGVTYRNRALLDLMAKAPHCMRCSTPQVGQVVGAHRNGGLVWGRGLGHKCHDLPAALCFECHSLIDSNLLSAEESDREWLKAAVKTWLWLMQSGHLKVVP